MTPNPVDDLPVVGPTARSLGVRPDEVTIDATGAILAGGMSAAPDTPWNLPPHRRPRRLGRASTGPNADIVYEIDSVSVTNQRLAVDRDAPDHVLVRPDDSSTLTEFGARLERTRPSWTRWAEERP